VRRHRDNLRAGAQIGGMLLICSSLPLSNATGEAGSAGTMAFIG
jgi:hypothetical protein